MQFDSECDIAAIVYRSGEDPDSVLADFFGFLSEQGHEAVGVVQRRTGSRPDRLLFQIHAAGTVGWESEIASDTGFAQLASKLLQLIHSRPEIVILNRFGSFELRGGGLATVLGEVMKLGIPAVIAVPEVLFPKWLNHTGGLAVRVDCRLSSLVSWWNELDRPLRRHELSFCEQAR
jgi:hypothetical protein